jgi:hypothetical protein
MSEEKFAAEIDKAKAVTAATVSGNKEVVAAARAEKQREKADRRAAGIFFLPKRLSKPLTAKVR